MGNRAGQAQACSNLGLALIHMGDFRHARWRYTLAREAAIDAEWSVVRQQAEAAIKAIDNCVTNPGSGVHDMKVSLALCPSVATSQVAELRRRQQEKKKKRKDMLSTFTKILDISHDRSFANISQSSVQR